MEARNYSPNAQHNMILSDDAQIVAGVIGNGVYLPAGCGTVEMSGTLDAMGVSIWRMWDGVTETVGVRGIFSFKNFGAYFDNVSDKLTVMLPCGITVHTDIPDDTEFNHWVFNFIKNGTLSIYKNAVKVYEAQTAEDAVDLSDGFTLGGGRTHATFDEVYVHTELLKEEEVNGLCYLIRNGMPAQQIQEIAQSGAAKYLGVTETVPDNRGVLIVKGEHLGTVYANTGDWVLMSKTVGGWKTGVCYRWSGLMWINLEPEYNYEAQYQACLAHICEIPELTKDTGHYGALFAKLLVTQEAFIEKLVTSEAFIDRLITKRLLIDSDTDNPENFELKIDENIGICAKNNNKKIFEVSPNGNASFYGISFQRQGLLEKYRFIRPDRNITPTQHERLWYGSFEAEKVTVSTWETSHVVNVFVREWTKYEDPPPLSIGFGGYIEMLELQLYYFTKEYKKSVITLKNGETKEATVEKMRITFIGEKFSVKKSSNPVYQLSPPQPYDYGDLALDDVKLTFNIPVRNLLIIDNIPDKTDISVASLPKGTLYKDGDLIKIV